MVSIQKLVPKVSIAKATEFITSKEVLIAGAVIVLVPLLFSQATGLIAKVPFLRDHFTVAFLVLGFLITAIGFGFGGMVRTVIMGVGAGFAITGIAPQIRNAISQVRNR